ncbi:MAG: TIGR00730 family Rossman fold protein [Actinobacteria bacterium]|nr:TIGR00730 family Rossman fold protein [Actinomycetota bacterium]
MTNPPHDPAPPADRGSADREPLAYHDARFIESDEGRPLRILAEYLRPLGVFRRRHIHDTIVFFGSARIREGGPLGEYYAAARELSREITSWSEGLKSPAHRYLVCTGGGPGIMEAANRGAQDAGGRSIGLNIGLPHEQRPNPFITPGLSFEFRYFFMRKLWFAYVARAIIVFPGGFGTLDELFEFLTLSQTGKIDPPVATLLFGSSYWNEIVDFDALVRHGMVSPEDLRLLHFVDSPAEAMAVLRRRLSPQEEPPGPPAIAKSVTPEDECEACGPEKEQHP